MDLIRVDIDEGRGRDRIRLKINVDTDRAVFQQEERMNVMPVCMLCCLESVQARLITRTSIAKRKLFNRNTFADIISHGMDRNGFGFLRHRGSMLYATN